MGKGSVIILGKGESALRCDINFVNSFDKIVICNYPVFGGYEKHFPSKFDIQYRNKSCKNFTKQEISNMGISEIVFTGHLSDKLVGDNNHNITVEYPGWHEKCESDYGISISTGVQAFMDLTLRKDYDTICMIGFDLFDKDKKPYFFGQHQAPDNLKYLWNSGHYNGDNVNFESGHDTGKSFDLISKIINENKDKQYIIMSDYEKFKDLNFDNLKII